MKSNKIFGMIAAVDDIFNTCRDVGSASHQEGESPSAQTALHLTLDCMECHGNFPVCFGLSKNRISSTKWHRTA
ncbi:hypothetical protein PoB_005013400 [Plakobranchus ocellatus]|uniref:Uncharacterized protein n=1 Tax=Plakobranchus ocellatus TaxID=259542 RepID=A0AAV4BTW9_9GAST|nr:hypothetical protein PoB_005013400 [Plakobranchus ocellatus]